MSVVSGPHRRISGFESPEGPCFDRHGDLYFVNWKSGSIIRADRDGTASEWFNTGGIPAGLAFDAAGDLYVADEGDDVHGILRITPDGDSKIVVDSFEGRALNGANDLVFADDGSLYFSDPWRSSLANPIGAFYRLRPGGELELLDDHLAFPNGVAISADGSALYLAETPKEHVLRYPVAADGAVGRGEPWARMPEGGGPDGMAFDERGYLYVALVGLGRVCVFAPDGSLSEEIDVPGSKATNCAFGGPDRTTLYVTEVDTASVYTFELDVAGQPLPGEGRAAE